jgi:hypothetical protein
VFVCVFFYGVGDCADGARIWGGAFGVVHYLVFGFVSTF